MCTTASSSVQCTVVRIFYVFDTNTLYVAVVLQHTAAVPLCCAPLPFLGPPSVPLPQMNCASLLYCAAAVAGAALCLITPSPILH